MNLMLLLPRRQNATRNYLSADSLGRGIVFCHSRTSLRPTRTCPRPGFQLSKHIVSRQRISASEYPEFQEQGTSPYAWLLGVLTKSNSWCGFWAVSLVSRAPIESSNYVKFDSISIELNYRIRSNIRWFDRTFHVIISHIELFIVYTLSDFYIIFRFFEAI